jgi:hypothetical protein
VRRLHVPPAGALARFFAFRRRIPSVKS